MLFSGVRQLPFRVADSIKEERHFMQKHWSTKVISGIGLLSVATMFCGPAKADEKSAALYKQKCAACHGTDGKGETPTGKAMKVRSFADPEVAKMSDDELASAIEKGKGKMPAYSKSLKPDEIKAIVAYIRSMAK
jgi:mono/diheme cytochrome c family protein